MDTGLAGTVALVTGASRGIGAATARLLRRRGRARRRALPLGARGEAEALARRAAGRHRARRADVTREDEVDALFAAAVERYGRIDSCVANAGVWIERPAPVAEMTLEQFERTIAVDLVGVFLTARAFLRVVARQASGALVLVGSTAGLVGEEGHADYAAAKSAVTGGLLLEPQERDRAGGARRPGQRRRARAGRRPRWRPARSTSPAPSSARRAPMALRKVATPEDVARADRAARLGPCCRVTSPGRS